MADSSPLPTASPDALVQQDPFAPKELHMPKEVEEWFQTLSPAYFKNYKDIESTWNYPFTQFTVALVGDPQFRSAMTEISHQDHLARNLVGYEVIWVILIWIFKAWRLPKAPTWLKKLWIQLWVGALFWTVALLIVPFFVVGTPFKTILGQLIKAMIHHLF